MQLTCWARQPSRRPIHDLKNAKRAQWAGLQPVEVFAYVKECQRETFHRFHMVRKNHERTLEALPPLYGLQAASTRVGGSAPKRGDKGASV